MITSPSRSPTIQSPGDTSDPADDDRDLAVGQQLPAHDAVLRSHVAREHREVLAQDVLGVARAAVEHRAGAPARGERRRRQFAEVRSGPLVGLVDRDAPWRDRAQHLEDLPDRRVVVVARMRTAEHRVHRSGEPHARAQRDDVGRQRLLSVSVTVEHIGQCARVDRREAASEIPGCAHGS